MPRCGTTQGAFATGVWVIAHECGHGAFSDYGWVNDAVGLVSAAAQATIMRVQRLNVMVIGTQLLAGVPFAAAGTLLLVEALPPPASPEHRQRHA